jgi:transcriptional regulator with XRE-family HTH domain
MVAMALDNGPVVQRALLTGELRSLRRMRDENQEHVAKALEWSTSKLIRVEGGSVGISRTDLEALLRHYGVTDEDQIGRLAALARGARASAWWDDHKISDKAFLTYIGYEAGASSIKMAQGLLVPGILQNMAYARGVAAAYVPETGIEDVVRLRDQRQKTVFEKAPEQYHLLDEAVIRRKVGDAMPGQLRHLAELAERSEITIRIIPFKSGPHFGMRGPFALLGFAVALEDVLYLESARRGDLLIASPGGETVTGGGGDPTADKTGVIAEYREGFDQIAKLALEPQESLEFIEQVAHDIS